MEAHEGRAFQVNGAALHVRQLGSGTPVVLVHGGLITSAMWDPLLPALRDGLRLVLPDSRGHGRSTDPDGSMSFPRMADDVAALIGELGLERPVVGGYSDGGQVVLELGARHPEVAGALVVGGAYPDWAGSGLREVWREFVGADPSDATHAPDFARLDASLGEGAAYVRSLHPGGEARWRTLVARTASMWLDYAGLTDDELARIRVPTLVFGADHDAEVTLDLTVALFGKLPNAELAICPGADHAGPIGARAGQFAAAIRDFVARHAATRR